MCRPHYFISFVIVLFVSGTALAQNHHDEIIIAIDTTGEEAAKDGFVDQQAFLKSKNGELFTLIKLNNYRGEFNLKCVVLDSLDSPYVIFENYGSAAGVSMIFIFDITNRQVYQTQFLSAEDYLPVIQSYNPRNLTMMYVVFDNDGCGRLNEIKLNRSSDPIQRIQSIPKNFKTFHHIFI
jgi:hypothetical protein